MSFFIDIFQLFNAVVGVHLGSSQAAVTKQFLYRVQVGPIIGKVGGKTMPEDMWTFLFNGGDQA